MPKPKLNMGASVRRRLLNIANERGQSFQLLLTRYVNERLLYRLTQTQHRDHFLLKGAVLLMSWFDDPLRPTRDLDLLGFGDSDPEALKAIFREVCAVKQDDGVVFDIDGLTVGRIREETEYGGLRIKTTATIGGAKVPVAIDVAFGDAVEPEATEAELPVLLDVPPPRLRVYPREAVIAEKFQAMVVLGRANSRMKDFYDIWILARSFEFKGDVLARAIAATFIRRETEVPKERPDGLTSAFAEDQTKIQQWNSFIEDVAFRPGTLASVVEDLAAFLMPHSAKARALSEQQS
jgi:predicted nucleotidyltransferase component of viral defense system